MIDGASLVAAAPGLIALGALLKKTEFESGTPALSLPGPATCAAETKDPAPATAAAPTTKLGAVSLARANFKQWNDALQTKNAQTVATMYINDELSFLPTVSPQHIKAGGVASNTEDYFVEFVKKNPFGTITDDSVDMYDNGDAYLHSVSL